MASWSLDGKVALITGSASGIGAEVAKAYAELGADLVLADLDFQGLEDVRSRLSPNINLKLLQCNLGEHEECTQLVQDSVSWKGHIDILVNCAALYRRALDEIVDKEFFDTLVNVNMAGPFFLAQACSAQMKKQGSGKIILFTSIAAFRGGAYGSTVYAMTKAAVTSLMKSMANELAPWGICVNAVAPGGVDTPMMRGELSADELTSFVANIPLGRLAMPNELADVCCFIASDAASYITGHTFHVNGGQLMH